MSSMMGILQILIVIIACGSIESYYTDTCPAEYKRISPTHTFCIPRNTSCNIVNSGVNEDTRTLILAIHNKYRSRVARGAETRVGGLPEASNMMQMEWDEELAAIAQKWASNCNYKHDCRDGCRDVPNFSVGQNIGYVKHFCMDKSAYCKQKLQEDWVKLFYGMYDEEIIFFDKRTVVDFTTSYTKEKIGHFTQMIWADTWRIGCGYSYFEDHESGTHYFVCNYGPGSNIQKQHIYKPGPPCSACPTNTCCGKSCGRKAFKGLCKMLNPNTAPIYPKDNKPYLFYCDFNENGPDCNHKGNGQTWNPVTSLSGEYRSVRMTKGETMLKFTKTIRPQRQTSFCLNIYYRKKSENYAERNVGTLNINYQLEGGFSRPMELSDTKGSGFLDLSIDIGWAKPTKISLTFSVPANSGIQIVDVKKIVAYEGNCNTR